MDSRFRRTGLVLLAACVLRMSSLGRGRLLPATVTLFTLHQCWGALVRPLTWLNTYRKRSSIGLKNWAWHEDGHRLGVGPVAVGFALLKLPVGDGLGASGLLLTWMRRWSVGRNGYKRERVKT